MARPLVLIYEELAAPTAIPVTPDLNTVIVGPAYDIFDYPDDATTILLTPTVYGQLNLTSGNGGAIPGYVPPTLDSPAVTVLGGAYPGQSPGSVVNHSSVELVFKFPRVVLASTYLDGSVAPVIAAHITTTSSDQTLVAITPSTTTDFVALGIQPGDTIILTSSFATEQDAVRVVQSVGNPNAAGLVTPGNEIYLRLTQALPPANSVATGLIQCVAGSALVNGQLIVISDGTTVNTFEYNTGSAAGGHVHIPYTGGDSATTVASETATAINGAGFNVAATPSGSVVNLANTVVGAQGNVPITTTVSAAGFGVQGMAGGLADGTTWTYDTAGECRIERTLPIQTFVDPSNTFVTFPQPGTDNLILLGAVQLPVVLTSVPTVAVPAPVAATVDRTLSYTEIYLQYAALRQDLQNVGQVTSASVVTVNNLPNMLGVGKIDARNPLAVGLSIALQNSGAAPIYFYGVASNDTTGHLSARSAMASRADLYCFVPLVQDTNVIAGYNSDWNNFADPTQAQTNGVAQKFRIVLGSTVLPTNTIIYPGSINGVTSQPAGAVTNLNRTLSILASCDIDLTTVLPGDTVIIGQTPTTDPQWQNRRGTHTVGHVNSSYNNPAGSPPSIFELIPGNSRWNDTLLPAVPGDIELLILASDGTAKVSKLGTASLSIGATMGIVMKNPVVVGGPYTVQVSASGSLAGVQVTLTGFAILATTNGSATVQNVIDALNASPTVGSLITASLTSGSGSASATAVGATPVIPQSGSCTTTVQTNDGLFNQLTDSSALFLTSGVKPGDIVELPLNPNNYLSTAFVGRTLIYKVAQVQSENAILIANGLDDTGSAANELPHYFARDEEDTYIRDVTPNAMNYRVRRALQTADQVTQLIGGAQSFQSKRTAIMWPDVVDVADLNDGSQPRTVPTTPAPAALGTGAGYYIGCMVGGAVAGLPCQQGLTNIGLVGISKLYHSQGYFTEQQLAQLSDGGLFVMIQPLPTDLPYSIHQNTTDVSVPETGELSVVKNIDFVAIFFQGILGKFIGRYNVIPETLIEIGQAVTDGAADLMSRRVAHIGAPLLSGSVTSLAVSTFAADRVVLYFTGSVPIPLNTIEFHLVV